MSDLDPYEAAALPVVAPPRGLAYLLGTESLVEIQDPYTLGWDLVETALLFQGLLCVREYFDRDDAREASIRGRITGLWESVEWDWYTRGGDVLYWHWSPRHEWAMEHPIYGWNECLIAYVLAIMPAFTYLHRRGMVYCDFKPDNLILVGEDELLKVLDFGEPFPG